MKAVILVPRREGFPDRDALWAWCRPWWQHRLPDYPMVEGHHEVGLFNRSAAVNTAARLAGEWDVALIIDSDVICRPEQAREAVALAHDTGRLVVAFTVRHNLNRVGTQRVMEGYEGSWTRWVARDYLDQHSSVIAVPRRLWDAVGGFDEAFTGWGQEDTAFAIACETFSGPRINLPGECWHLYHATAPEARRDAPSRIANRNRGERYKAAWGDRAAMAALRAQPLPPEPLATGIPKIFHRVIPAQSNPVADRYWQQLQQLHPGWQLQTHQDPLDAALWPLTAPYWALCQSGASLADLVRLEALSRHGGVYLDWDCRPVRSLEPLLALEAFAGWEDASTVPNAVIGARPGHPAIKACLDLAVKAVRRNTWAGGPGVTTEVLPGRPDVLLLPPEAFYPVHYRDPDRDGLMNNFDPAQHPATFVLHEYWGSWLEARRQRVPAA